MNLQRLAVAVGVLSTLAVQSVPAALANNPPGPAGGSGHGRYWHYNKPGAKGGPGRGWVYNPPGPGKVTYRGTGRANPPGPAGGCGHGPNWRYNPAGRRGGPGRGWVHNAY